MKELIRKFEKESGLEIYGLGARRDKWEYCVEKFAELIVKECIDCARGAGLADDVAVRNGLGFNDGISEAVTHMKQHFGVEE